MHLVQNFLIKTLGAHDIRLVADGKRADGALVQLGGETIASMIVDDEDGDRSYALTMPLPVARARLQDYLRSLFKNQKLTIVMRPKKTDSVELHVGGEYIGIISADDAKGEKHTLEMAILDIDLEEI